MVWRVITGIGTLLFAAIALFAIFYPELKTYYKRPKFSCNLAEYGPTDNHSVFLNIKNVGKSPANDLHCLLKVEYNEIQILNGKQLPSRRITTNNVPGEVYDGIDLYPTEEIGFQILHLGARRVGQPKNLLEITSYPWTWNSDAYAELNSFDRKELKVGSEQIHQMFITLVDKNRIHHIFKFKFLYDGKDINIKEK